MGRKKKRLKPIIFCYYCDRTFENEKVLIQHQRAKHFKCVVCHKRLGSAHGMMVHVFQVHKQQIDAVPHAKEQRDSFDIDIFGMAGVPQDLIDEKRLEQGGEPAPKRQNMGLSINAINNPLLLDDSPLIPGTTPHHLFQQRQQMMQQQMMQQQMMAPQGNFVRGLPNIHQPYQMMGQPFGFQPRFPYMPPQHFRPPMGPLPIGPQPQPNAPQMHPTMGGFPPRGYPPRFPPNNMRMPNFGHPMMPRNFNGNPMQFQTPQQQQHIPPSHLPRQDTSHNMQQGSQPIIPNETQDTVMSSSKKKNTNLVYGDEVMSMEEMRFQNPKYFFSG